MAKKKRKHFIKLNNKIRSLFGDKPFDEGVATLDDDRLLELVMLLDIPVHSLSRDDNIRTLRRVWSEGDYTNRKMIVDHLLGKVVVSKNDGAYIDKVDMILDLLDEIEHTKDEEELILAEFLEHRTNKITLEKITAKLSYLRLQKRITSLQDRLEVEFSSDNRMEFYHSFVFECPDESFSKTLLLSSSVLEIDLSDEIDDEKIISFLEDTKRVLIEQKKEQIAAFISSLGENRYIDQKQSCTLLRGLPVSHDIYHTPLPLEFVESLVLDISPDYYLIESGEHFVIQKDRTTLLYGVEVPYRVIVTYTKNYIYGLIWHNEDLPIKEDMSSLKESMLERFEQELSLLFDDLLGMADGLDVEAETIREFIVRFLAPQLENSGNLKIKEKSRRRVFYHFQEYLKPLKEKKMKQMLLAQTIRDFKQLFPLARSLKRKITFHAGPTNSGKTYSALSRLKEAESGYYLAPLRLLALEGYEDLNSNGVPCSLITGEEEIIDEDSAHISSTIEMMNPSVEVECCVIDEIQMIDDRDRGWAWANALIGAPAKEVILTGSSDAVNAVKQIAEYLGEELEIIYFERKNPLKMMSHPTSPKQIKPQSAIVTFSRKEVLAYRQRLSGKYRVSVVYGNLSPEVRREEARKFREGESEILIATDAIAMGLNLPIRTILFARDNKFDGLRRRELTTTEVLQISGRAGRYGIEEVGYVGALDNATLTTISDRFHSKLPDIGAPFSVMASLDHALLIGEILETENILEILEFFAENMEFEGPFVAANMDTMMEIAAIVDGYELDLRTKYHLSCAPVGIKSPYLESAFRRYIGSIEKQKPVLYIPPRDLPPYAHTADELLNAEDRVKEVSLYLWLSFKFPDYFEQTEDAIKARSRLNSFIEKSLQKGNFTKTCQRCGKVLDFGYRFSICEACYTKAKRGDRSSYPKRKRSFKKTNKQ